MVEAVDADYFSSYDDLQVHSLMLQDRPRLDAYQSAIELFPYLFKNKVVLDVGAGTGILSLFCAKAGAKKVFAVEASDAVSVFLREIVSCNGYEDVICVLHGKVEDVVLPEDVLEVDVIISEWMGFYLLHESMLDSVIVARDRWLKKPGGVLFPSRANLYVTLVNCETYWTEMISWTNSFRGFDFSPLDASLLQAVLKKPVILSLDPSQCDFSNAAIICSLDLYHTSVEQLETIESLVSFVVTKSSRVHGYALWFDVSFTVPTTAETDRATDTKPSLTDKTKEDVVGEKVEAKFQEREVCLSTSPWTPSTHWKQAIIFFPHPMDADCGLRLKCDTKLKKDSLNKRRYQITLEVVDVEYEDGSS